MDLLDKLLAYIQKTNPSMTRELLINRLCENSYSSLGLIHTWVCCDFKNKVNDFDTPGGVTASESGAEYGQKFLQNPP